MTGGKSTSGLGARVERVRTFIFHDLWQLDLGARSVSASLIRFLQFSVMVGQGFVNDRLLLRASALTFMTALSAIPLLVVVVALVGLVGGQESLVDMAVKQLTAVSPEANRWIISRIQEVHIGNLGTLGGATLILSAILGLRHLESTLGDIWGVRQSRSWPRRFADYLAVLVVGPILTGVAVSLWASLASESLAQSLQGLPFIGWLHELQLIQLPQVLIWAAFGFLYWFFPNTNVSLRSAALGALVATLLFSVTRVFYVDLGVGAARYSVLFGGLVALPLVLTWLYVCWAVILFGAEVAFAHQNIAHYREDLRRTVLAPAEREYLAVRLMVAVARAFKNRQEPRAAEDLSGELDAPVRALRELLDELETGDLLVATGRGDREARYLPARPIADTTVADVIQVIRSVRRAPVPLVSPELTAQKASGRNPVLDELFVELDDALVRIGGAHTLSDLASAPSRASVEVSIV
jgi:membrane protein